MHNEYRQTYGACKECTALWGELQKQKEQNIEGINKLLKTHIK